LSRRSGGLWPVAGAGAGLEAVAAAGLPAGAFAVLPFKAASPAAFFCWLYGVHLILNVLHKVGNLARRSLR